MIRIAQVTGWLLRGLILGALVVVALNELLRLTSGARIFEYQGF